MKILRTSLSFALLSGSLLVFACSSDGNGKDPDAPQEPGTGSGGGTEPGPGAPGEENPGGENPGPTPPGETADTVFQCPSGWSGKTPTLAGKTPSLVATASALPDRQSFLEGPVWIGETLYVSQLGVWGDPAPGRILRLAGDQLEEAVPQAQAGTNGLAVRSDGKLIATSQRAHGILIFDPENLSQTPEIWVDQYEGKGFNSPNDLTVHSNGTLYFTDPDWNCGSDCPQGKGNNRVYRITPAGEVAQAIKPPHGQPNGIALSLDQSKLYVAGDNHGIVSYSLDAEGAISEPPESFASVTGVDGLTLDCAGNLYVTVHSAGKIAVYTPSGTLHGEITVGNSVTNVAFGGPQNQTLYVTTNNNQNGELMAVELDIPGLPY